MLKKNNLRSILYNKVYNEFIHYPLNKMAENLIHRYKFYHFDAHTKDVQHEVIAFVLEKLQIFLSVCISIKISKHKARNVWKVVRLFVCKALEKSHLLSWSYSFSDKKAELSASIK